MQIHIGNPGHTFEWRSTPLRLVESDSVIRVCSSAKAASELTIQWIGIVHSNKVTTAIQFALDQGWDPRAQFGLEIGADANFDPIAFTVKPEGAAPDWFFNENHGFPQQNNKLHYHQPTFDLVGLEPLESIGAKRILSDREAQLGFPLPASVREFYSVRDAPRILAGGFDIITPMARLGHDYTSEIPLATIFHDWDGPPQLFLHFDGKPDPTVRMIRDGLDEEYDADGLPKTIVGSFSQVTLQQASYLLEMQTWKLRHEEKRAAGRPITLPRRLLNALRNAFKR